MFSKFNIKHTETKIQNYKDKIIAIDGNGSIDILVHAINASKDEEAWNGQINTPLNGLLLRIIKFLKWGIKPVYVFEGKSSNVKKEELEVSGNASSHHKPEVTEQDTKKMLKLLGIPYIDAPSKVEAQCAAMIRKELVDAVATDRWEALAFYIPTIIRYMTILKNDECLTKEINFKKVLEDVELDSVDKFVDMCILMGCDYCEKIVGIAPITARDMIRECSTIEEVMKRYSSNYTFPEGWDFQGARDVYRNPKFINIKKDDLQWTVPDKDGLISFLCGEKKFNQKVLQRDLDRIPEMTIDPE